MPEIEYSEYFLAIQANLPKELKKKLAKALRLLANNPRHPSLQTKPVKGLPNGSPKIFEARIDQGYRITYERLDGDILRIRNIGEHNITDKNP